MPKEGKDRREIKERKGEDKVRENLIYNLTRQLL